MFREGRNVCASCTGTYRRAARETLDGRANIIMQGIRQRTKRSNLPPATVDKAWVVRRLKRGVCAVTKIPFEFMDGDGHEKANPYVPSADRKNPAKGYTKENTQLVVWAFNRAKGEYADSTFTRLASMYLEAKGWTVEKK